MKDSDCLEWTGYVSKEGYGQLSIGGVTTYVHRNRYESEYGPIPEGLLVRHKCDNRKCYLLDHLELGTHQDNKDDCVLRGRQAKGEMLPQTKMNSDLALQVRLSTLTQKAAADVFGISQTLVSLIRSGKRW